MRARTWKLIALGYLLKSVALALAWYAVPDLPERVSASVRSAWEQLAGRD